MTPERNEFDGMKTSKSSAGSQSFESFIPRDNARRPSTRVPLHLRASTTSCHDICKHGRRHSSEEEARARISKPVPPTTVVKPVKSRCSILMKSSPACKLSPTNRSDAESATSRDVSTGGGPGNSAAKKSVSLHSHATIKREVPLPSQKVEVPVTEGKPVDKRKNGKKAATTEESEPGRRILASAPKGRNKVQSADTRTSYSEVPEKIVHVIEPRVYAKARPLSSEEVGDVDGHPTKTRLSSSKSLSPSKFPPMSSKEDDKDITCKDQTTEEFVTDKIIVVEAGKAGVARKKHNQDIIKINCGRNGVAPGNTVSKKIVEMPPMKETRNKIPITRRAVLAEGTDKHSSPTKLYFRRARVLNLLPPDHIVPRRLKLRQPGLIDPKPSQSAFADNKSVKTVVAQLNKKPPNQKKLSGTGSQKAADLQLGNNSTSRSRLKMTRSLSNESGGLEKRSFKKNNRSKDVITSGGAEISSQKRRLKHRPAQKKTVTGVLLNNVIEETANKLVESRKSKVKALVGAFETVISLKKLPLVQIE